MEETDLKTMKPITGIKTNATQQNMEIDVILEAVKDELIRATDLHGSMRSSHEGYAILKEEVDELWDDVKANAPTQQMGDEAIQVAAMAVRFIYDICYRRWEGEAWPKE